MDNDEQPSTAQVVLNPLWYPTYLEYREALWLQLIRLNTTLFNLERIENFPFDLFTVEDQRIFWRATRTAFIETALSIEWKLLVDNNHDSLNVFKFKNAIMLNVQDPDFFDALKTSTKAVDLPTIVKQFEPSLSRIRHSYVGHLNESLHLDPTRAPADLHISTNEMRLLLEKSRELFDILCLEQHHSLWMWGYSEYARNNDQTDIDAMLASVARNSNLMDMPETEPQLWADILSELNDFELQHVNAYRLRFGLHRVDR